MKNKVITESESIDYLNPRLEILSYTGGSKDMFDGMRVSNILDITPMRHHRSQKGINHVCTIKCDSGFQLSNMILRNQKSPIEVGQYLQTGVIITSDELIDIESLKNFKSAIDANTEDDIKKCMEENYADLRYFIFVNQEQNHFGFEIDLQENWMKGYYLYLWTIDGRMHDLFYDLEYLGFFGSFDYEKTPCHVGMNQVMQIYEYNLKLRQENINTISCLESDKMTITTTGGTWNNDDDSFRVENISSIIDPFVLYVSDKGTGHIITIKLSEPFRCSHFYVRNKFTRFPLKTGVFVYSETELDLNQFNDLRYETDFATLKSKCKNFPLAIPFQTNENYKDYESETIHHTKDNQWPLGSFAYLIMIEPWAQGFPEGRDKNIELEMLSLIGTFNPSTPSVLMGQVSADKVKCISFSDLPTTPVDMDKVTYILDSFYNGDKEDGARIPTNEIMKVIYNYRADISTVLYLIKNLQPNEKEYLYQIFKDANDNFALWIDRSVSTAIYNSLAYTTCVTEEPIMKMNPKTYVPIDKDDMRPFEKMENVKDYQTKEYRVYKARKFTYLDIYNIYMYCELNVFYNAGVQSMLNIIYDMFRPVLWIINMLLVLEIVSVFYLSNYAVEQANYQLGWLNTALIYIMSVNIFYTFISVANLILQIALLFDARHLVMDCLPALADFWKYTDLAHSIFGITYANLKLNNEVSEVLDRQLLAIYLMLLMAFVLKSLSKSSQFGPFIRALLKNFVDIIYFLVLQLIFVIGFGYVFYLLYEKTYTPEAGELDISVYFNEDDVGQYADIYSALYSMYKFAFLGDFDFNFLSNTLDLTLSTFAYLSVSLIVPVVALNALIAILGESYGSVSEFSEGYSYREKMYLVVETWLIYSIFSLFFYSLPLILCGYKVPAFKFELVDKVYVAFELGFEETYEDETVDKDEKLVNAISKEIAKSNDVVFDKLKKYLDHKLK